MEPKIRQPHHNFTEAVRHPEPASNLERYGEQKWLRAPSPKTKQMQDIKCVCVCVCQMYTWAKSDSVQT